MFTWLRSFDRPITVRITAHQGRYTLIVKRLDGKGGYEPGKLDRESELELSKDNRDAIQKHLESTKFWSPQPPDERRGARRKAADSRWALPLGRAITFTTRAKTVGSRSNDAIPLTRRLNQRALGR